MVQGSVTSIVKEADTGKVFVNFSGYPYQLEFTSLENLRQTLQDVENLELAAKLILARALALSPDLTNVNQIVGKTYTFDLSAVNIFRIQ